MQNFEFQSPMWLWALVALLPMVAWYIYRILKGGAAIQLSSVEGLGRLPRTWRYYLRHLPMLLRLGAVAMLIVALARPRTVEIDTNTSSEGIDIVLALDVSGSMLARDFRPDRLEAAKEMAGEFVTARHGDRIGLVVFAGESYTQSPLTTDYATLQTALARLQSGIIEDGTAIGNGLATAINRLRESEAKSKVVILLTDGVNNRGEVAPLMAAQIAKELGIRLYTIGVGRRGEAPYPAYDMFGNMTFVKQKVEIDEESLTQMANMTGGSYFRATDNEALRAIYEEINRLEKSKVEIFEQTHYTEYFYLWLGVALLLLALEFLLRTLLFNRIP